MLIAHPEKSLGLLLDEKKNFPTIVRVWIYVLTRYGRENQRRRVSMNRYVQITLFPLKERRIGADYSFAFHNRDSVVSVSIIFHRVVRFLDALSCTRVQLYGVLL